MAIREPEIIRDKQQMRNWSRSMRSQGKTIGLVPTMGYLHQGHLSLITEARKHTQLIVVSIYVNPGQFAANEDLSTYPSDFRGDIEKLKSIPNGVDVVFNPQNLYDYGVEGVRSGGDEVEREGGVVSCLEDGGRGASGHETWIRVERLEKGMCGKSRPVFFRGVATVVAKLFNIVEPDVAVFGKKDYQQWRIIQRMVSSFQFHNFSVCFKFKMFASLSESDLFRIVSLNLSDSLSQNDHASEVLLIENYVHNMFRFEFEFECGGLSESEQ